MASKRVVIIGCNSRVDPHVLAYRHIDPNRARVVACCDVVSERAEKSAKVHGLTAYTDAESMIKQVNPDLVHVATGPKGRYELMQMIADAKVPACTVEKPVACAVRDWRSMSQLSASAQTRFAVCHQFRWQEDLMRCREALASGELGDLIMLDVSAGFNISGQGTHLLHYARSFNGDRRIVEVFGAAGGSEHMSGLHAAPSTSVGVLVFDNGVRCVMHNGYSAPRCGDPEVPWQHVRLAGYAERGRVLYEEFGRWQIVRSGRVDRGSFGGMDAWSESSIQAQARFHEAMLDWLDGGQPAGTQLSESLHEWQVILAMYASTLWRRPIRMASFDPPDDLCEQLADELVRCEYQCEAIP